MRDVIYMSFEGHCGIGDDSCEEGKIVELSIATEKKSDFVRIVPTRRTSVLPTEF